MSDGHQDTPIELGVYGQQGQRRVPGTSEMIALALSAVLADRLRGCSSWCWEATTGTPPGWWPTPCVW